MSLTITIQDNSKVTNNSLFLYITSFYNTTNNFSLINKLEFLNANNQVVPFTMFFQRQLQTKLKNKNNNESIKAIIQHNTFIKFKFLSNEERNDIVKVKIRIYTRRDLGDVKFYINNNVNSIELFNESSQFIEIEEINKSRYLPALSPFTIIPGVIGDDLFAMKLLDLSTCQINNLSLQDLNNENISIIIDDSLNIFITMIESSSYYGNLILSINFNIFDKLNELVRLNYDASFILVKDNYDLNSILNISQINNTTLIIDNCSNDIDNSNYTLRCNNNIITISGNNIISGETVNSINFNLLADTGEDVTNSLYLHLTPFTGYDLSLGANNKFQINKINSIDSIDSVTHLKITNEEITFAKLFVYGYTIFKDVDYFNINNITMERNYLLKLDSSNILIGKIVL